MTHIPGSLPPSKPVTGAPKGDVPQEMVEADDLTTTFVVPRSLKRANEQNDIGRLHHPNKRLRSLRSRAQISPVGGDVHLFVRPIFRKMGRNDTGAAMRSRTGKIE